jgi:transcriptional regulator with XRE-family HTH domain
MHRTTYPEAIVTNQYRTRLGLTYRAFAEALNERLMNTSVTHSTVMNWEKGLTEPETDTLLVCLVAYNDWRMQFAIDCLCAKLPEVYERDETGKLRMVTT